MYTLARRRILLASTSAAILSSNQQNKKLSIYSPPQEPITLEQLPPSSLESNIALVRIHVEKFYERAHERVKDVVGDWINVEERVERRLKSFKSPSEPLTPGALYVFTSTLFASVLARSSLLLRFALPPSLFVLSSLQFLPETTHNVSAYVYELEKEYIPAVAESQAALASNINHSIRSTVDTWHNGTESLQQIVRHSIGWLQDISGLKLRETFGIVEDSALDLTSRASRVVKDAKQSLADAVKSAEKSKESSKDALDQKEVNLRKKLDK